MLQISETVLVACITTFLLTVMFVKMSRDDYKEVDEQPVMYYVWLILNFSATIIGILSLAAIVLHFIWR